MTDDVDHEAILIALGRKFLQWEQLHDERITSRSPKAMRVVAKGLRDHYEKRFNSVIDRFGLTADEVTELLGSHLEEG